MAELPPIDVSSWRGGRERKRRVTAEAPPLGVRHLLLGFSCCAAYLAAVQALAVHPAGAVGALQAALLSLGYGAAWMGLAIFVARRLSAKVYLIEPGEWLLAILGGRLAVEVAVQFVPSWLLAAPQGLISAATCLLLTAPLLSRTLSALWKGVVATMLFLYALPLAAIVLRDMFGFALGPLETIAGWLDAARTPALLVLLSAAAVLDRKQQHRRSWLHGVGLIAWLWSLALAWVTNL